MNQTTLRCLPAPHYFFAIFSNGSSDSDVSLSGREATSSSRELQPMGHCRAFCCKRHTPTFKNIFAKHLCRQITTHVVQSFLVIERSKAKKAWVSDDAPHGDGDTQSYALLLRSQNKATNLQVARAKRAKRKVERFIGESGVTAECMQKRARSLLLDPGPWIRRSNLPAILEVPEVKRQRCRSW